MPNDYVSLSLNVEDHIATVSLIGPGKGNTMGSDFWREVPKMFAELDQNDDVRVIILRGSGKLFTYGLDLMSMMTDLGPTITGNNLARKRTELHDLIVRWQDAGNSIAACRKPVIAAIHNWCIGGGLDMVSACDIRICSADARFSLRETKIAIVADMGSLQRLPAIIGQGNLRELAFTGKDIDAAEAERIGLVNRVHQSHDELFAAARAMATEIAQNAPTVVQGVKRVIEHSHRPSVQVGLEYVATWNAAFLQSNDLAEAIAAFMQKREAKFTGS